MLGGPLGGERWEVGARGGIPPALVTGSQYLV